MTFASALADDTDLEVSGSGGGEGDPGTPGSYPNPTDPFNRITVAGWGTGPLGGWLFPLGSGTHQQYFSTRSDVGGSYGVASQNAPGATGNLHIALPYPFSPRPNESNEVVIRWEQQMDPASNFLSNSFVFSESADLLGLARWAAVEVHNVGTSQTDWDIDFTTNMPGATWTNYVTGGFTFHPGIAILLRIRLDDAGLHARMWEVGSPEPYGWTAEAYDNTKTTTLDPAFFVIQPRQDPTADVPEQEFRIDTFTVTSEGAQCITDTFNRPGSALGMSDSGYIWEDIVPAPGIQSSWAQFLPNEASDLVIPESSQVTARFQFRTDGWGGAPAALQVRFVDPVVPGGLLGLIEVATPDNPGFEPGELFVQVFYRTHIAPGETHSYNWSTATAPITGINWQPNTVVDVAVNITKDTVAGRTLVSASVSKLGVLLASTFITGSNWFPLDIPPDPFITGSLTHFRLYGSSLTSGTLYADNLDIRGLLGQGCDPVPGEDPIPGTDPETAEDLDRYGVIATAWAS